MIAQCSPYRGTLTSSPKAPRDPFYNLFLGCRSVLGDLFQTTNEGCEYQLTRRHSPQPALDAMIAIHQHAGGIIQRKNANGEVLDTKEKVYPYFVRILGMNKYLFFFFKPSIHG